MERFETVSINTKELIKASEAITRRGQITNLVNEITQMQASIENMALGNSRRKAIELRNSMIIDVPIVQSLIDHKKVELILLGTNYEQEIKTRTPWS